MSSGIRRFLSQIDLGGNRISSVATGTAQTDAVNYGQVQSLLAGVAHYAEARAASTTNVSLAAPGASIDGVTLNVNDRVLLKNQTNQPDNGVYVWAGAAAALTRANDSLTSAQLVGQIVSITDPAGTQFDKAFIQSAAGPLTVGTTAVTYVAYNASATYTSGNGILVTGTTIAVNPVAGGGIGATSGGVSIDTTVVARKYAASFGNGALTTFAFPHGLSNRDVIVQVYDNATFDTVEVDVVRTDVNTVTVNVLGAVPANNALRVLIQG